MLFMNFVVKKRLSIGSLVTLSDGQLAAVNLWDELLRPPDSQFHQELSLVFAISCLSKF